MIRQKYRKTRKTLSSIVKDRKNRKDGLIRDWKSSEDTANEANCEFSPYLRTRTKTLNVKWVCLMTYSVHANVKHLTAVVDQTIELEAFSKNVKELREEAKKIMVKSAENYRGSGLHNQGRRYRKTDHFWKLC